KSFEETINLSITETLSRTLITSGTTLLVVLALFLLGGEIIHDFAFALLVGVLIGTYSSIYVASPVAVFLTKLAPPAGTAPATT
ncbi:MAG: protein translocase subunit SecDF, partial [Nitrospinaceae bacterium]|nr:protein translocase subunit SecDF [Nitrospinaceae bacterium]